MKEAQTKDYMHNSTYIKVKKQADPICGVRSNYPLRTTVIWGQGSITEMGHEERFWG